MIAVVHSTTLLGVEAHLVRVEVDVANGLPSFQIVGLPDASVRESRDRVRSAIKNSGLEFPLRRVTVNLAPADLRKFGACFDLAIALGVVAAGGGLPRDELLSLIVVGELSLDGRLLPVRGVLSVAALAHRLDDKRVLLPKANAPDALVVPGVEVVGVDSLAEAVSTLAGGVSSRVDVAVERPVPRVTLAGSLSLDEVGGQAAGKRALTIAAAGGHHLLLIGPPGAGKTMLARRLPGLLPQWSFDEALEATTIHSAAGLLPSGTGLLPTRPFRAPHHTASSIAIVGGGRPPRAGEVSLAHHGVLFLDEFPEFSPAALESLRQPLEDRRVVVTRSGYAVAFPAHFQLVAAMNPCPCGYAGGEVGACRCSAAQRARYAAKLSGPLLDRLDLVVVVERTKAGALWDAPEVTAEEIRRQVARAHRRQRRRAETGGALQNADLEGQHAWEACAASPAVQALIERASERLRLSARSLARVARVSRTIADLEGSDRVTEAHVLEALHYRREGGPLTDASPGPSPFVR